MLSLPNPAPEVDMVPPTISASAQNLEAQFEDPDEPRKKKYAKEAWPGKKPTASFLV